MGSYLNDPFYCVFNSYLVCLELTSSSPEIVPIDVNALYEELHDAENDLKATWRREPLEKWFREYSLGLDWGAALLQVHVKK